MPYPERLERDVRRGHALRRSGLVPLLSLSQSSQHEIYCFPRGRVIYTLRVCYDYHIIKYSRRYKTGATTTIHISIVSVYRITKKKREIQSFWTSACKSVVSLSLCSTSPSRYKGWGRKEGTHLLDAPSVRVLSPSSSHSLPHDR